MARSCVFCGQRADSAEHLWPDWIRRREAIRDVLPHAQIIQRGRGAPDRRDWSDHPYKMTVRAVCSGCNNGWMSDLEQRVELLMRPMLQGRGRTLQSEGQRTLASWALKTAMMFDQAAPRDARVIPLAHYRALHASGEPPRGVQVWLAAYDATQVGVADVFAAEVTTPGQDDPPERNVYVRTFTMGTVAFQVFGTTNRALFELEYEWPIANTHGIWPYREAVVWTPRPAMSDAALSGFSERIIRALMQRAEIVDP